MIQCYEDQKCCKRLYLYVEIGSITLYLVVFLLNLEVIYSHILGLAFSPRADFCFMLRFSRILCFKAFRQKLRNHWCTNTDYCRTLFPAIILSVLFYRIWRLKTIPALSVDRRKPHCYNSCTCRVLVLFPIRKMHKTKKFLRRWKWIGL